MWRRRAFLAAAGAAVCLTFLPLPAAAEPEDADEAIRNLFGDRPIREGKVTLKLPPIAENGNSVQLTVSVDSPMTEQDHVRKIAIISPRNPIPEIAIFNLGPYSGRAEVSTRVRLAGTQSLRVIAEMNDGSLWVGKASTYVTLAACIIG
ncbi:sulfur oxidation protein SoxY [Hyphomonas hirschiana VP5]|uniref:Sulfur oxidation protein SoxY n=1 Tax=Hyphomonas hirschiana VP5 TaxID=1280951 RepID=A0A059FXC4_9PROT|nr:sulfur oxidation protein SoxY [Hyphomonas hirschiana VP5]